MKAQKNKRIPSVLLYLLGLSLCILPPAICTLSYFPLWRVVGYEYCIAGGAALLLALCLIPLYKLIKKHIATVSSYIMWLILFLIFFALSRIAEQMTVISFVGFVGNLMGAVCFYISKRIKEE